MLARDDTAVLAPTIAVDNGEIELMLSTERFGTSIYGAMSFYRVKNLTKGTNITITCSTNIFCASIAIV